MRNVRLYVTFSRAATAALLLVLGLLVACRSAADTQYIVTVQFSTDVTLADIDGVAAYLQGYDTDVDFLIQESFPPTGVARFEARAENVCSVIEVEMPTFRGVESVTCAKESDGIPVDGDTPVSSTGKGR